jgi:hypothetical protein
MGCAWALLGGELQRQLTRSAAFIMEKGNSRSFLTEFVKSSESEAAFTLSIWPSTSDIL